MSTTTSASTLVSTNTGPVRGRETDHGHVFLGVPYAAPPLGAARFAPPRPHEVWTQTRDAVEPGPSAPQPFRARLGELDLSPFFGEGWIHGDDYLTVNVWTPRSERPAPVILFVHGGAFLAGSTNAPAYDGLAFARDGVVFVTANYRLGIPGFLHLPDAPDNRGKLDIVAALRWIRKNIAAFGGDPDNVTLAGQSAGGIIVSSILSDPIAKGLFRRVIIQSGSGTGAFTTEQANVVTASVSAALGFEASAARLSDVEDSKLVALMPGLGGIDLTTATARDPLGGITPFSLVLNEQPVDTVVRASTRMPDLLIGSNADESTLYLAPFERLADTTERDLLAAASRFDPQPDQLISKYRAEAPGASAAELRVAILSDGMFRSGTRRLAEVHGRRADTKTFVYEFAWRSDALDSTLGSSHLMELPFVFDQVAITELHGPRALLGATPTPQGLADDMHGAWVQFASTGSPGWEPAEPDRPNVRVFGPRGRDLADSL